MSIVIADMLILGCCVLKDTLKGRRKFWWIIYEVSNLSSIGTARRKAQFLHSFEYPGDVNFCFTTARTWRDRVVGVVIKLRVGRSRSRGSSVVRSNRLTLHCSILSGRIQFALLHAMKAQRGVDVELCTFLSTLTLDGSGRQTPRDSRFAPGKVAGGLNNLQCSGYWRSFTDYSSRCVKLTTQLHLRPRLGIRGAVPPLPTLTPLWCLFKNRGGGTLQVFTYSYGDEDK